MFSVSSRTEGVTGSGGSFSDGHMIKSTNNELIAVIITLCNKGIFGFLIIGIN